MEDPAAAELGHVTTPLDSKTSTIQLPNGDHLDDLVLIPAATHGSLIGGSRLPSGAVTNELRPMASQSTHSNMTPFASLPSSIGRMRPLEAATSIERVTVKIEDGLDGVVLIRPSQLDQRLPPANTGAHHEAAKAAAPRPSGSAAGTLASIEATSGSYAEISAQGSNVLLQDQLIASPDELLQRIGRLIKENSEPHVLLALQLLRQGIKRHGQVFLLCL